MFPFKSHASAQVRKDMLRSEILQDLQSEKALRNVVDLECRAETKRQAQLTKQKIAEKQQLLREEEERKYKEARLILEIAKAQEEEALKQEQLESLRKEKFMQAIRENSSELKELEKKLNEAYLSKQRSVQIQEKILALRQRQSEKIREGVIIKQELEKIQKEEEQQVLMEQQKSVKYQAELERQLQEREQLKKVEYEEYIKEKQMVDEIVAKILEENERELKNRLEKRKETQDYIKSFLVQREKWKKEEEERRAAEDRAIAEFVEQQRQRDEEKEKKKKEMEERQGEIYSKLTKEMQEKERARMELEQLRIDLLEAEEDEKIRNAEKEMMEKRIKKRLELITSYQEQIELKRSRLQKEREEEDVFRARLLEKFAQDEKIEQMAEQKRRMKKLEHKRAVEEMIKQKRQLEEQEKVAQIELEKRERELEKYKQDVVEQERRRLLLKHAKNLVGFLPKGILKDGDLDLFDEEFRKKFEKDLTLSDV